MTDYSGMTIDDAIPATLPHVREYVKTVSWLWKKNDAEWAADEVSEEVYNWRLEHYKKMASSAGRLARKQRKLDLKKQQLREAAEAATRHRVKSAIRSVVTARCSPRARSSRRTVRLRSARCSASRGQPSREPPPDPEPPRAAS